MSLSDYFHCCIDILSALDGVLAIGKSGGEALPDNNESDIDVFVFCDRTPDLAARLAAFNKPGLPLSNVKFSENTGRFWGVCDFASLGEADLCIMYFTIENINEEIESALQGLRPDRIDEYFYPTGRCATILSLHVLYDKTAYIAKMKEKLSQYPLSLSDTLFHYHIRKINDEEDFQRAVARGDVLFFHSILEIAMDHYLQALFALNKRYFPGRKRSLEHIQAFGAAPHDCSERLLSVVALGSKAESLSQAYAEWTALCQELIAFSAPIE